MTFDARWSRWNADKKGSRKRGTLVLALGESSLFKIDREVNGADLTEARYVPIMWTWNLFNSRLEIEGTDWLRAEWGSEFGLIGLRKNWAEKELGR